MGPLWNWVVGRKRILSELLQWDAFALVKRESLVVCSVVCPISFTFGFGGRLGVSLLGA